MHQQNQKNTQRFSNKLNPQDKKLTFVKNGNPPPATSVNEMFCSQAWVKVGCEDKLNLEKYSELQI